MVWIRRFPPGIFFNPPFGMTGERVSFTKRAVKVCLTLSGDYGIQRWRRNWVCPKILRRKPVPSSLEMVHKCLGAVLMPDINLVSGQGCWAMDEPILWDGFRLEIRKFNSRAQV